MRRLLLPLFALALCCGGCAALGGASPQGRLREGTELAAAGKEEKARAALLKAAGEKEPGVSDEALFRLALLQLRGETDDGAAALQTLERLKKEYPRSPWTVQAAPLAEFLAKARKHGRSNASLLKENRELRRTIEKLKNLDLELEQKNRR